MLNGLILVSGKKEKQMWKQTQRYQSLVKVLYPINNEFGKLPQSLLFQIQPIKQPETHI